MENLLHSWLDGKKKLVMELLLIFTSLHQVKHRENQNIYEYLTTSFHNIKISFQRQMSRRPGLSCDLHILKAEELELFIQIYRHMNNSEMHITSDMIMPTIFKFYYFTNQKLSVLFFKNLRLHYFKKKQFCLGFSIFDFSVVPGIRPNQEGRI